MRRGAASRCFVVSLIPLCVSLTLPPAQSVAGVVINEVLYDPDGPDTGLEFVELMNCGRVGVSLTGWVIETGNGAGPDDWTVEWIGDDLDYLDPGQILLVGESDVVPEPDYITALDLQNGPDGVRLTDGDSVLDVVGWGEPLFPEYCEGEPTPDVQSGHSLGRSPDCFDHDNNALDFVECAAPTPGVRNALEYDLSIRAHHKGPVVQPEDEPVDMACTVTNVGASSVSAGAALVELIEDSSDGPTVSEGVGVEIAPRDSVIVSVRWHAPPGYHRARLELLFAADRDVSNNTAGTSLTVGRVGGTVRINEIMYSPPDGSTEWVELVGTATDTVGLVGWRLGDDEDQREIASQFESLALVAPGDFLLLADDAELLVGLASSTVIETDGWETLSAEDVVLLVDDYRTPIDRVSYPKSWGGDRGVSLERVRPDLPADDPANWGSSVAPEGSTPGRTNSIHLSRAPASGRLTLVPNPFTPDGDGESDRTVVRLELPVARATARVTVFDLDGRVRAILMDHKPVASSSEFVWDGLGTDGTLLPSGLYVVYAEAIDAAQGVFVSAKAAVGIVRRR